MTPETLGFEKIYTGYSEQLSQDSGKVFLAHLKNYVQECGPVFPSIDASLRLLDHPQVGKIVDKMVSCEIEGQYRPFSHAIALTFLTTDTARQINMITRDTINSYIVDEPLLAVSAFLHDIGNMIGKEEIESLKLDQVDLAQYTKPYPKPRPASRIDEKSSHILKTIVFLKALGFGLPADITAHSAHHLNIMKAALKGFEQEDKVSDNSIPIERALLMLADLSVVDKGKIGNSWFGVEVIDLQHRAQKAYMQYAKMGKSDEFRLFLQQFAILKAFQSLLFDLGVVFPLDRRFIHLYEADDEEKNRRVSSFINQLHIWNIKRGSYPTK